MTPPHPSIAIFDDDPYSDENLTNPYPLFDRMRAAGPAVWLERYGVYAFTRYEPCREILDDYRTFISGAGVGPKNFHREPGWRPAGILESDPPDHTALRVAMTEVISPRGVRPLRADFQEFADTLLDDLEGRRSWDAVTDMAEVFPIRVFGDAVGIPRDGRTENLLPHGAMNFSAFGPEDDRYEHYFTVGQQSHAWVMENCRRENLTPGGLGDKIWERADAGDITADQATVLVRAMLSAGLDTTVIAIGNAIKVLSENPDQWKALHGDPRLAKFAIDEAFRLESPFQSFFRTVNASVDFHGIPLAEEEKIVLFIGAANRDTERWGHDADQYRIDRSAAGHLAFGMGIHQCVGQPISRLELDVLLTGLAKRAATLTPTGPATPYLHNTLRGWSSMPVTIGD